MALEAFTQSMVEASAVLVVGFLVTFFMTPRVGSLMKRKGIVGVDVHKKDRPLVPEMGGVAILLGFAFAAVAGLFLFGFDARTSLAFIATVGLAGVIGLTDDLRPLNPKLKPLLTAVSCMPILLLGAYTPRPELPFIGGTRLTIVYPLLIPLAIAIPANAVNMLDVVNGAAAGTVAIVMFALVVALFASGQTQLAALALGMFGCLLAFYWYNRYPSRIFGGDTASLAIGASVGALAVIGRIEIVAIVALIPHIMNAFYGLSSVGRLYERREVRERPTKVLSDGRMAASSDPKAPITLLRLILAEGPLTELQAFRVLVGLSIVSSILGLITFDLVTRGFF